MQSGHLLKIFFIVLCQQIITKAYAQPFATQQGIFKTIPFGQTTKTFDELYDVNVNNNGIIFLATNRGIFYNNGYNVVPLNKSVVTQEYTQIRKLNNGSMFFCPFNGQASLLLANGKLLNIKLAEDKEQEYTISSIREAINGNLFLGMRINNKTMVGYLNQSDTIIHLLNEKDLKTNIENKLFQLDKLKLDDHFKSILKKIAKTNLIFKVGRINTKFIYAEQSLFRINEKNINRILYLKEFNLHGRILEAIELENDSILFSVIEGTNGIYSLKNGKVTLVSEQKDVCGLYRSKTGELFIGSRRKGLLYQSGINKKSQITTIHNLEVNKITSIINENKLVLSNQGDLYKLSEKKLSPVAYNIGTQSTIQCLDKIVSSKFKENQIEIRKTDNTIGKYKIENEYHSLIADSKLIKLLELRKQKKQLLIFTRSILQCSSMNSKMKPVNFKINDACILNNNKIELATNKGLYNYFPQTDQIKRSIYSATSSKINYLQIIPAGNHILYRTTTGNYYRKVSPLSNENNKLKLALNTFPLKIIPLEKDSLYLGINKNGFDLFTLNGKILKNYELPNIAAHLSEQTIIDGYVQKQHLILYNASNIFKIPMDAVYHLEASKDLRAHLIKFSTLSFSGRRPPKKISPRKINPITLCFAIANRNDKKIHYELFKNNELLISAKELLKGELEFNHLGFGKYKLVLKSDNIILNQTEWNIKPFWYQTIIFRILLILISMALVSLYFYFFGLKKERNKNRRLEREKYLIELESTAKLNQLKPHFIFNMLTPLQNYIYRNKNKEANNYLRKISTFLRETMHMTKNNYINIKSEIEFLKKYLDIQKEKQPDKFDFEIHQELNSSDMDNLLIHSLLVQPLVENAINYGKSSSEEEVSVIKISFVKTNEMLLVIVNDNGEGFNTSTKQFEKNHAIQIIKNTIAITINEKQQGMGLTFRKTTEGFEAILKLPILYK